MKIKHVVIGVILVAVGVVLANRWESISGGVANFIDPQTINRGTQEKSADPIEDTAGDQQKEKESLVKYNFSETERAEYVRVIEKKILGLEKGGYFQFGGQVAYKVKARDTLSGIAEEVLGNYAHAQFIEKDTGVSSENLSVGQVLVFTDTRSAGAQSAQGSNERHIKPTYFGKIIPPKHVMLSKEELRKYQDRKKDQ